MLGHDIEILFNENTYFQREFEKAKSAYEKAPRYYNFCSKIAKSPNKLFCITALAITGLFTGAVVSSKQNEQKKSAALIGLPLGVVAGIIGGMSITGIAGEGREKKVNFDYFQKKSTPRF